MCPFHDSIQVTIPVGIIYLGTPNKRNFMEAITGCNAYSCKRRHYRSKQYQAYKDTLMCEVAMEYFPVPR